jgi:tyrosine-protein kinase Etk/Wzc
MHSDKVEGWPRDIIDVLLAVAKRRTLTIYTPLAIALCAALTSFLIPNSYTARAQILPPAPNQDLSLAMLSQFGVVGQLAQSGLGLKNPNEMFVSLLKSQTVADGIIKRFELSKIYAEETLVETRKELDRHTFIDISKGGSIFIEVDDRDPARAASIANAYVEQLQSLAGRLSLDEANTRRAFFEKHLLEAKTALTQAAEALKIFQEKNRLAQVEMQGGLAITATSQLRAQIAFKEIELASLGAFATGTNPQVVRVRSELFALQKEMARLEGLGARANGDKALTLTEVPKLSVEYVAKLRDVKYYEALVEALAKQYELARVEEARGGAPIQIIDHAVAPDKKSGPKRSLIVIFAWLLSTIFGVIAVIVLEKIERSEGDPTTSGRIHELGRLLLRRRPVVG